MRRLTVATAVLCGTIFAPSASMAQANTGPAPETVTRTNSARASVTGTNATIAQPNSAAQSNSVPAICPPLRQVAKINMVTIRDENRRGVPVLLNGQPKYFLLDTGAAITALFPTSVLSMKLPIKPTAGRVYSVSGGVSSYAAHVNTFSFGNIDFGGGDVMIFPGMIISDTSREYAGLLSPELFWRYDVEMDFARNTLNLFSRDHCDGQVVYWSPASVSVIPIKISDSNLVTLPVKLDGVLMEAVIDTGAPDSVLNLTVAGKSLNVDLNAPEIETIGDGDVVRYRKRFHTMEFEGLVVSQPILSIVPDYMKDAMAKNAPAAQKDKVAGLPDIILGMNVLSKLHIYFATRENRLYVSPAEVIKQ